MALRLVVCTRSSLFSCHVWIRKRNYADDDGIVEKATQKVKEVAGMSSGEAKGKAHEAAGAVKGKAAELSGEAKGKANEVKGKL